MGTQWKARDLTYETCMVLCKNLTFLPLNFPDILRQTFLLLKTFTGNSFPIYIAYGVFLLCFCQLTLSRAVSKNSYLGLHEAKLPHPVLNEEILCVEI